MKTKSTPIINGKIDLRQLSSERKEELLNILVKKYKLDFYKEGKKARSTDFCYFNSDYYAISDDLEFFRETAHREIYPSNILPNYTDHQEIFQIL